MLDVSADRLRVASPSMQDRYVGDVGDFAKYALLRKLYGRRSERSKTLGVVWCRFPNESHNQDGRHISYLRQAKFEDLDDALLHKLRRIVSSGRRRISDVSRGGILPRGTVFCDAWVSPDGSVLSSPDQRTRHREAWLTDCLAATGRCDLIFFDPDNGLETPSVPKVHRNAGKYIYWDELAKFWLRGANLLVYHHLNRTRPAINQVDQLIKRVRMELPGSSSIPLVFRRGSCRVFLLIHRAGPYGRELERRAVDFLSGAWAQHFWPVDRPKAST
jgi:hypothetical protein